MIRFSRPVVCGSTRTVGPAVFTRATALQTREDGPVGSDWPQMTKDKQPGHGQRWDIETAPNAMKRRFGSTLAARTPRTLKHGAAIIAVTYTVMV